MILITLFILSIAILYFLVLRPYQRFKHYTNQGYPGNFIPIIGLIYNLIHYRKTKKDCFYGYKTIFHKHPGAEFYVMNFGASENIHVVGLKSIKDFYQNHMSYKKGPLSDHLNFLAQNGLLMTDGNQWKQKRKLLSTMFHFDFVKSNIPLVVKTTREILSQTSLKNNSIMDTIQEITGDIVGKVFLGENLNDFSVDGQKFPLFVANTIEKSLRLRVSFQYQILYILKLQKIAKGYSYLLKECQKIRDVCSQMIKQRKKLGGDLGNDLIGLILKTQQNPNPEERYTDEETIDEFITFFIAGMDTTGHLVTMALYLLLKNPQYLTNVLKEIDHVYDKEDIISHDQLQKLDKVQMVIKETLRMYNPAPGIFPRVAIEDNVINDTVIRKGTRLRVNPLPNMFNPEIFVDPFEFKPDRWEDPKLQNMNSFLFIPFSAGGRNCIGQHLAMIEAKVILCEFLKKFSYKLTDPNYELVMAMGFLYEPESKIHFELEKREIQE